MIDEPEGSVNLREEWMTVLFVAIIVLAIVAGGVLLMFGV
jgi:nitrate reductase NapE component